MEEGGLERGGFQVHTLTEQDGLLTSQIIVKKYLETWINHHQKSTR